MVARYALEDSAERWNLEVHQGDHLSKVETKVWVVTRCTRTHCRHGRITRDFRDFSLPT